MDFTTQEQQLVSQLADALVISLGARGITVKTVQVAVSAEVTVPAVDTTFSSTVVRP